MGSDWDRIVKIELDKIDGDNTDVYYELISDCDIDSVDNVSELRKAFYVAEALLTYKFEENKLSTAKIRKLEDALKKVQEQKKDIEIENAGLQRLGAGATDRELIQEKRGWEIERERLEGEVDQLKDRLREVTKEKDELAALRADLTRETERLTDDNRRLNENFNFLKTQNEQLRERAALGGKGDDVGMKQELSKARAELRAKKAMIDALEDDKAKLYEDVERLQENVRIHTFEMDKAADEHAKMKHVVAESDRILEEKVTECDLLKAQVANLSGQFRQKGDADDQIMVALESKVEEWKTLLAERDTEIVQLYQENRRLRHDLSAAGVDSDRASMQAMLKALKERDTQVKLLEEQLSVATKEIETNAEVMSDMRHEMDASGRGPSDRQAERIRELLAVLKEKEQMLRDMDARRITAEHDAEDKDKELLDLSERMRRYEEGEYGLSDAVGEIKAAKAQINVRDRQIEELCQSVNKSELALSDMRMENGHLREKCGIAPDAHIDIDGFRRLKAARDQEDRALNMALQNEIENLEEERLQLKRKVRLLARQTGHQAGSVGIPVDDVLDMDKLGTMEDGIVEEGITMKRSGGVHAAPPSMGFMGGMDSSRMRGESNEAFKIRMHEMDKEVSRNVRDLDVQVQENTKLSSKVTSLQEENDMLQGGLREVRESMQQSYGSQVQGGVKTIDCPTLDKLLAALDAKKMVGDFDAGIYMKARIDNLEGRNDELRHELREFRVENSGLRVQLEKTTEKANRFETEVKALHDMGAGGAPLRTFGLPEGMSPSSTELIAGLNEHLVHVLQEVSLKEDMLKKLDAGLDNYRRKYALCRHQQGLLYRQYADDKKAWEEEKLKLQEKLSTLEGSRSEDMVRLTEFDRLVDTLSQEEPEVRRRLGEMTRQITVLKVNEKALVRRYTAMQDIEQTLRRENNRMKNEMIHMESAVTERLGYYQRYKEAASFKIGALQKALDDSVTCADMDRLQRKHDELTEKYRNFLERQNALISRSAAVDQMEAELRQLKVDNDSVKRQLTTEKEKRHTLETAFEAMDGQGRGGALSDSHVDSISKRLTTLEMKELNERERADHASKMYESLKITWTELDRRNKELEDKFAQLTKVNLEMQKIERELRDELTDCVSKKVSEADKKRVMELERSEMKLKHEVEKLKEISDIATSQAKTFQESQVFREKEVTSLRQQLLDIQSQSDEKTVIGKLHRHLVQLQLSESTALRRLEDSQRKVQRLESTLLRMEQRLDDKSNHIYHMRMETRGRTKHLKDTISSLRSQFAGSVPLGRQEKFTKTLISLQEEKARVQREYQEADRQRAAAEDELAGMRIKWEGLQELTSTLKDGRGASKVVEWHARMEQLRLDEMKQKRQVERLRHQIHHLEAVIKSQESQLSSLEEDNARLLKDSEEQQLGWEQREIELERSLANLEAVETEVVSVAGRLQEAQGPGHGDMPDPRLPLPNQLEQAVASIKKNLKVIYDQQAENRVLKEQIKSNDIKIKELERTLLKRERFITELRLRLPATDDRDSKLDAASKDAMRVVESAESGGNWAEEKAFHAAQTTVSALQARLHAKEQSAARYQQLLKEAREELDSAHQRYSHQLRDMQNKLNSRTDEGVSKLQAAVQEITSRQMGKSITHNKLVRLQELEELAKEQSHAMALQSAQVQDLRKQADEWRLKYDQLIKGHRTEKELLTDEHHVSSTRHKEEAAQFRQAMQLKDKEMEAMRRELERVRADNAKAPTNAIKSLVERLKNQLTEKEKQHNTLSKALTEIRRDMVQQAEETVKVTATEAASERDLQRILDKHTRELADELEQSKETISRLRKEQRTVKQEKEGILAELDELKIELGRKDGIISRARSEKNRAEQDMEDLQKQLDRMKSVRRLGPDESQRTEVEDLRRKVRLLEEENRRWRLQAEKPYEQEEGIVATSAGRVHAAPPTTHEVRVSGDAGGKWEDGKRVQKQVDRMKAQVQSKEMEKEKMAKQLELTKNALDRANKEKEVLESRLTKKWGPGALLDIAPSNVSVTGPSGVERQHMTEELRHRIHELEEELSQWRRGGRGGEPVMHQALHETQSRCQLLQDRVDDLERQLIASGSASSVTVEKDRAVQKEVLRLNEENIELRFEVEASRKELPRLKERVQDLQKYVELLKSEKGLLEGRTDRSLDSTSSSLGNIKRIGESGKSTKELEKTIARLKKVVERTQSENERLKCAPGVVSNEQLQLLKTENESLKGQVGDLRTAMGQKLADRYDAKERGTIKLMTDYERLRKEQARETETHDRTRKDLRRCQAELETARREVLDLRGKLEIEGVKRLEEEGRAGDSANGGPGGWKSAVTTRMYEGRLKEMDGEIEKKTQQLGEMRRTLKEWAEREQAWMRERNELLHKITVLERASQSESGDPDLSRQAQQHRLRIDRLEAEKDLLASHLADATGTRVDSDLVAKLRDADRIMHENVELRLQVRQMETEKDRLSRDRSKMQKELSSFGPEFFEDIEDLKFKYKQSIERNSSLETQLRHLSKQFGVSVNL